MLRRNATDPDRPDRPAIRFGDQIWTHAEFAVESIRWADLCWATVPPIRAWAGSGRATHVGVLSDNTPDYLFAFGGCRVRGRHRGGTQPDPGWASTSCATSITPTSISS